MEPDPSAVLRSQVILLTKTGADVEARIDAIKSPLFMQALIVTELKYYFHKIAIKVRWLVHDLQGCVQTL